MDMRSKEMKRLILVSIAGILFGIFIIIVGLQWLSYSKGEDFTPVYLGYLVLGSIIIIITLLHFYKSITDLKKGIPIEDERSRRIFFKSAALAFFITLFMRIIIIAIENGIKSKDKIIDIVILKFFSTESHQLLIAFLIFGLCWLYYYYRGELAEGGGW